MKLVEHFQYGLSSPICLTWELTYACNLACVHCLSSSGRRDPRELSTAEAKAVIDELQRMQVFYVNIGGGEPTVRPDFWELLDYAIGHDVGVKFSTNGIKLDKTRAAQLARTDYVDVQISLDGATAAVNDHVRGPGSFDTAVRALENLAEAGFAQPKISVVMTRQNVDQLDEFKAIADKFGAQLRITRLRPSGRGADVWDELHPLPSQQKQMYDWLVARGDQVLTGDSFFHLSAFGEALPGLNLCGAGRVVCLIDPVGDVYACPFAIHESFLAGNVRSPGGFQEVWEHSELFTELRQPQTGGACASCQHYDSCQGGCMAAKFFTGLPLDGPDPECVQGYGEQALAARSGDTAIPRSEVDHSRSAPRNSRTPKGPGDAGAGHGAPGQVVRPEPPGRPGPPGPGVGPRLTTHPLQEGHLHPGRPQEGGLPATLAGPVRVGPRTAPSRVLFGPHETNLGRGRAFSDRHTAYYLRRAVGGAGVIVTETASVHDSDWPYERAPLAADAVDGWAEVVAACRPHGALVLAGLGHAGGQGSSAYGQRALWGPSRVADVGSREVPMAVEQPEIDALVAGFAAAARLAVDADLDGVEVDAGQHSLLRQFLSGLTNHRTDAYGTDRSRLLREVLDAVRAALGPDRVLGLRLCCDELAPWAGITPDAARATIGAVAGLIDHVVPVRGCALSVGATRPDQHTPPGFNRGLCAGVPVPVVLQGSVVDPAMAQAALDDGVADLVEMTRAQIADPDLVAHVRAGTLGRIRPCTLSNQRSAVRDPRNPLVSDDAEPRSGHETLDPPVEGRDPEPRDVLVVGGGPAGLEAARVLALRGHRVRLAERGPVLGGALRWAAAVPGRERFGLLVAWWERELARLGVDVALGTEVTAADLDGVAAVLATGSRDGPRDYPADVPVLTAAAFEAAVLAAGEVDAVLPPGPVLVRDPVGDGTGVGIAEQLAAAGRATRLVTPDPVAGTQLAITGDLAPANARLERAGVVRELLAELRGVSGGAELEHVWTGARRTVPCAAVVDCGHRLPDDALWRARPDLPRAGDCVAPRTVHEAVREGRWAARAALRAALC